MGRLSDYDCSQACHFCLFCQARFFCHACLFLQTRLLCQTRLFLLQSDRGCFLFKSDSLNFFILQSNLLLTFFLLNTQSLNFLSFGAYTFLFRYTLLFFPAMLAALASAFSCILFVV